MPLWSVEPEGLNDLLLFRPVAWVVSGEQE
jgi:hypothetical protein